MPISLPPISRRRFLAGSLAAGATAFLPDALCAAEQPADPHRWILLADTHIAENREQVRRGVKPAQGFGQARREILALPARPAGLIVAGDCVYLEGKPGDYRVLAEEVKPLRQSGLPLHLVLGNHDNRDNFFAAFADALPKPAGGPPVAKPPVADKHVALLETPHANWFLLDSLLKTNHTPGELGKAQLDWLGRSLDARADKPALVLAHHDPDSGLGSGLLDTKALLAVLAPRKQVKAYVFGHTHRWQLSRHDGIHLINLPATAWVFAAGEPRGWVDATLAADGINLELRCLDAKHPKHGDKAALKWRT